jgi:hypothetical protein
LVVWLQLNVSGLRPVLARGWHGVAITGEAVTSLLVTQLRAFLPQPGIRLEAE